MNVVADSSPLILLSKTGYFDLLKNLYPRIHISSEVYAEVVVAGAGLPGASKVANADWIEVKQLQKPGDLTAAEAASGLGAGELSTILLAKEVQAELALIDDLRARQLARAAAISPICVPRFASSWKATLTSTVRFSIGD